MSSSLPSLSTSSTEPSTSCHSAILHCRLLTLAAINTQVKDNKSHIQWSDRQTDEHTHSPGDSLIHSEETFVVYPPLCEKNVGFCSLGFLLHPFIYSVSHSLTHQSLPGPVIFPVPSDDDGWQLVVVVMALPLPLLWSGSVFWLLYLWCFIISFASHSSH